MTQHKKSPTKEEPFGISSKHQLLTCWKTSNSLHRSSKEDWSSTAAESQSRLFISLFLTHPQVWELLEDVYTTWNRWYICYIDLSKDLWITFPSFLWSCTFKAETNQWALAARPKRETLTDITKEWFCKYGSTSSQLRFSLGAISNGTNTFKSS